MRQVPASPLSVLPPTSSDLFALRITHATRETKIVMKLFTREVHTGKMGKTLAILTKNLPTILTSTCFNEQNVPFRVEVLRTEIGHLFEHILLEYLCQLKLMKGHTEAMFSGTTDWNWNKDPRGTFRISISVGKEDLDIFPKALQLSQKLLGIILEAHVKNPVKTSQKASYLLSAYK